MGALRLLLGIALLGREFRRWERGSKPKTRRASSPGGARAISQRDADNRIARELADLAERWRRAADQGDADGMFNLGSMYAFAEGVKDDGEAARWFGRAAEQGHARAMFNLGHMYGFGEGVPQNNRKAFRWYRLAAEQGYTEAQLLVGDMYAYGWPIPPDDGEAVRWYRLAAEQGHEKARKRLDDLLKG